MHDTAYYFEFDYAYPIDDGGHLPALHEAVFLWKQRRDQLSEIVHSEAVLIQDSCPVTYAAQTALTDVEKLVFDRSANSAGRRPAGARGRL